MAVSISARTAVPDGIATVNVIVDWLSDFDILSTPKGFGYTISRFATVFDDIEAPDDKILFLLDVSSVELVLTKHSTSLGVLMLYQEESFVLHNPPFDSAFLKRLIIIRARDRSAKHSPIALLSRIQSRLIGLSEWRGKLEAITRYGGSLQDLIDASEFVLNNYIDISNASFSLVAVTKNISASDTLSKELNHLGCHSKLRVDYAGHKNVFEEWKTQQNVQMFPADEISAYPYMTFVLRSGEEYRGHVVMVCNTMPYTLGLTDLFTILADACQWLITHPCEKVTALSTIQNISAEADFALKVMADERCSSAYIENQLLILNMEDDTEFRLGIIECSDSAYADQRRYLLSELKFLLPQAISFLHEQKIFVLLHGKKYDSEVVRADEQVLSNFCSKYLCTTYLSDRFHRIRQLNFAKMQALYALKYRTCIDYELLPKDNLNTRRIFYFEESFTFFCIENPLDTEFGQFCANHTVLDEIMAYDQAKNTDDVKVLFFFLFNERKATPTANQLDMHRNSVLYRIASMEKRYGFDLSLYETRRYILMCYHLKIIKSWQFRNKLL